MTRTCEALASQLGPPRPRADALLPGGTRLAHKTGDLPGLGHDAAIVFTPIGPRVVVVLTWEAAEDEAHAFIARVAQAAFETAR